MLSKKKRKAKGSKEALTVTIYNRRNYFILQLFIAQNQFTNVDNSGQSFKALFSLYFFWISTL